MMKKLDHIETWVFDLDHTLYEAESHVFPEMHRLMAAFVAKEMNISLEEAETLRRGYWEKHGTTLAGLMAERSVDPASFMNVTHEIDLSPIPPCTITQQELEKLPGRKIIFTNAPMVWAEKMMAHLDIAHLFDGITSIEHSNYKGKPHLDTYHMFLEKHGIDPKTACMFEDSVQNLKTAHDLGMSTVWIHHGKDADYDYVHHKTNKLADWLKNRK